MEQFINAFLSMGPYAYIIVAVFVLGGAFSILSIKMNKKALRSWLDSHPGAVKVNLESGTGVITSKELHARVVSGEAAVLLEKNKYVVYAMPGSAVLEMTYSYTRPGVLHRNVTTTWGPAKVEIQVEAGKEYRLSFDKKEENFKFEVM